MEQNMGSFTEFCKTNTGILTSSRTELERVVNKKPKQKDLSFDSFKERYLSYEEDKFLRVGDKISIPFLKDRYTKYTPIYTPIQFVVIDKEIVDGKHYVDLMSTEYRIRTIRWAINSTIQNTDIKDLIDAPYYNEEKKISSLVYKYLQEQVKQFPEEIQNAMVEKTVQPYIALKQGDKHFLRTESIGRIWPLSADEVYGKRVTKIYEDDLLYGLDQMVFFQKHPDFFDQEKYPIALRKTVYPHTISYIFKGYLRVTKRIETEFTTPICMRLQIHE